MALGCHTTSIGKGGRLSNENPYGPSACHMLFMETGFKTEEIMSSPLLL